LSNHVAELRRAREIVAMQPHTETQRYLFDQNLLLLVDREQSAAQVKEWLRMQQLTNFYWADALVAIHSETVVPLLTEALSSTNPLVVMEVMRALAKYGDRARVALPALTLLEEDSRTNIRRTAATAIERIAPGRPINKSHGGN
jgi:HEAT repeat protein